MASAQDPSESELPWTKYLDWREDDDDTIEVFGRKIKSGLTGKNLRSSGRRTHEILQAGEVDALELFKRAWDEGEEKYNLPLAQYVPWGSAYIEGKEAYDVAKAAEVYKTADPESYEYREAAKVLAGELEGMLERKTGGAQLLDLVLSLPKYAGEFGVGRAAVGAQSLSRAAVAKAMRELMEEAGQDKARKSIVGRFIKGQAWKDSAKILPAMELMPELTRAVGGHGGRTSGGIYRRMVDWEKNPDGTLKGFDRNELGEMELSLDYTMDSFIEAAPFAIADRYIEVLSEGMGGSLGMQYAKGAVSKAAKRVPGLLRLKSWQHQVVGDFMKRQKKLSTFADVSGRILKQGGWDGMWEEWLEERFGSNLRTLTLVGEDEFLLQWKDGREELVNWDRITPDWEQWAIELTGFAIPGATTRVADMALNTQDYGFKRKMEEVISFTGEDYIPHSADEGIHLEDRPAFAEENGRQPLSDMELLEWIETKYQEEVSQLSSAADGGLKDRLQDANDTLDAVFGAKKQPAEEEDLPTQEEVDADAQDLEEEIKWRTEELEEQKRSAVEELEDYLEENYPDVDNRDQGTIADLIESNRDEELRDLAVNTLNYPDIRGEVVEVEEPAEEVQANLGRIEQELAEITGKEVTARQVEAPTRRHERVAKAAEERYGVPIGFFDLEVDGAPSGRLGGAYVAKGPNGRPMVMLNQRLHATANSEQMASTILHEIWHDRWKNSPAALKKFLEVARDIDPERVAAIEQEVRDRYKDAGYSDEQIEDEVGAHLVEQLVAVKAILDRKSGDGRAFIVDVAYRNRSKATAVLDGFKSLVGLFGGEARTSYQKRLKKLQDIVGTLAPAQDRGEGQAPVADTREAAQLALAFDQLFEVATLGMRKAERKQAQEEQELSDADDVLDQLGDLESDERELELADELAKEEDERRRAVEEARKAFGGDQQLLEDLRARVASIEENPRPAHLTKAGKLKKNARDLLQNLKNRIRELEARSAEEAVAPEEPSREGLSDEAVAALEYLDRESRQLARWVAGEGGYSRWAHYMRRTAEALVRSYNRPVLVELAKHFGVGGRGTKMQLAERIYAAHAPEADTLVGSYNRPALVELAKHFGVKTSGTKPQLAQRILAARKPLDPSEKPSTKRQPKGARRVWQQTYEELSKLEYDPGEIDAAAEKLWESVDSDRPALTAVLIAEITGDLSSEHIKSVSQAYDYGLPVYHTNLAAWREGDLSQLYSWAEEEAGMPIEDYIRAGIIEHLGASTQQKRDFAEGRVQPLTSADIAARASMSTRRSGELYHVELDVNNEADWAWLQATHKKYHGFAQEGAELNYRGKRYAIASFKGDELQAAAVLNTPSARHWAEEGVADQVIELTRVISVGDAGLFGGDQSANNAASAITREVVEYAKNEGKTLVTFSQVTQQGSPYRALANIPDGYGLIPTGVGVGWQPSQKDSEGQVRVPKVRWMAGPLAQEYADKDLAGRDWEAEVDRLAGEYEAAAKAAAPRDLGQEKLRLQRQIQEAEDAPMSAEELEELDRRETLINNRVLKGELSKSAGEMEKRDLRKKVPAELTDALRDVEAEQSREQEGMDAQRREMLKRKAEHEDFYVKARKKINSLTRKKPLKNPGAAISFIADMVELLETVEVGKRTGQTEQTAKEAQDLANMLLKEAERRLSTQHLAMLQDMIARHRSEQKTRARTAEASDRIGRGEAEEGDTQILMAGIDAELKRHRETKPYVYIVTCGQAKRSVQSKAADMYTSATFTLSKKLATKRTDQWMILSGKHGLLDPDQLIDPYNETLKKGQALQKALSDPNSRESQIAKSVGEQAWSRFGPDVNFVILGPRHYVTVFTHGLRQAKDAYNRSRSAGEEAISGHHPVLYGLERDNVQTPLSGKTIIATNKWLKQEVSSKKTGPKKKPKKPRARGPRANPWAVGGHHYEAAMEKGEIDIITWLQANGIKLNAYFFDTLWDAYKETRGRHGGKGSGFLPKLFDAPLDATPSQIRTEWDQTGETPDGLIDHLRGTRWENHLPPVDDPNRPAEDHGDPIQELLVEAWSSPGTVLPGEQEEQKIQEMTEEYEDTQLAGWLFHVQNLLDDQASGAITLDEMDGLMEDEYRDALLHWLENPDDLNLSKEQEAQAKLINSHPPELQVPAELRKRETGQRLITGEVETEEVTGERPGIDVFPKQASTEIGMFDEQGGLFEEQAKERDQGIEPHDDETPFALRRDISKPYGEIGVAPPNTLAFEREQYGTGNVHPREFSDRLYRETSLSEVLSLLTGGDYVPFGIPRFYTSNNPDLALGQGANQGAVIALDTNLLPGRDADGRGGVHAYVEMKKPGDAFQAEQGNYEIVLRAQRTALSPGIVHVLIKNDAIIRDRVTQVRLRRRLDRLKAEGWSESQTDEGVLYSKGAAPSTLASDTPPPTFALRSEHTADLDRSPWVSKVARILDTPGLPKFFPSYQQIERMLRKKGVKEVELTQLNLEVEFGDRTRIPIEEVRGVVDVKSLKLEEIEGYFGMIELGREDFWLPGGFALYESNGQSGPFNDDRGSIAIRMSNDRHGIVRPQAPRDHGDYDNMLGWVRYDVREVNGEEVMFIHELQSDWYQKGQRTGFQAGLKGEDVSLESMGWEFFHDQTWHTGGPGMWSARKGNVTSKEHAHKSQVEAEIRQSLEPRGPWSTNDSWRRRILDRMVYEAAKRGHTKLAWATGASVVDLWSSHVEWDQSSFNKVQIGEGPTPMLEFSGDGASAGEFARVRMTVLRPGEWVTKREHDGPQGRKQYSLEELVGPKVSKQITQAHKMNDKEVAVSGAVHGVGVLQHYDQGMVKAAKELKLDYALDIVDSPKKAYDVFNADLEIPGGDFLNPQVMPAHVVTIPDHILKDRKENGVLSYALRPDRTQEVQETLFRRFTIPRQGWKERQVGNWQDYFSRVRQVQDLIAEQGGEDAAINDEIDTYLAEERFSGKVMEIHRRMEEEYIKPLRKILGELELTDEQKETAANPEQLLDSLLSQADQEGWSRKELRDELHANGFSKVVESRVEDSILQSGPKAFIPKINVSRNMIRRGGMAYKYEFDKYASNLDDLGWYMYALHADERNAEMHRRYPNLYADPVISENNPVPTTGPAGSGMQHVEAERILDRVDSFDNERREAFVEAAEIIKKMNAESLERRVETGLTAAKTAEHWRTLYPNYVPLRSDVMDESRDKALSGGYDIRGEDLKMAKGRKSLAHNPVIFSIVQFQTTAVRAEKNRVAQTFLRFVRENPDPQQWEEIKNKRGSVEDWQRGPVSGELVDEVRKRASEEGWSPERLQAVLKELPPIQTASQKAESLKKKQDIAVKEGGQEYRIAVRDTALLDAMKRMGELETAEWVQTWLGNPTRMLARMNTALDPEFILRNLFRDLQTAGINMQEFKEAEQKGFTRKVLKDAKNGVSGTWSQLRFERLEEWERDKQLQALQKKDPGELTPEEAKQLQEGKDKLKWTRAFEDFRAEGGKTAVWTTNDFKRAHKTIREDMARGDEHNQKRITRTLRNIGAFVDNANDSIENGIRVSVFYNARLSKAEGGLGLTSARAASLAKNITVNFNRKGRYGSLLNSAYMFANAGIQGNARIIKAYKNSARVRRWVNYAMTTGFFLDLINRFLGGDDEDGIPRWDKIPEYEKDRNLILMLNFLGIDEPIKIPMPWGYNLPVTAGRQLASCLPRAIMGAGKPAAEGAKDLFVATVENFNPLGSGTLMQTIAPTLADPFVMSAENKRWTGAPIRPEQDQYGTYARPRNQLFWGNVNPVSKAAADAWNQFLGGSDYRPGRIGGVDVSVSPEDIEEWVEFATGGLGRFAMRGMNFTAKAFGEEELLTRDVPFVRSFMGAGMPERSTSSMFYEKRGELYKLRDELIETYALEPEKASKLEKQYAPFVDLIPQMEAYDKELKRMRKIAKDAGIQKGSADYRAYTSEQDFLKKSFLREYFTASEGNLWWQY